MIHIAIEGMDGVGKSTVCNLLAQKLGYKFVEKTLHYLLDEENEFKEYRRVAKAVNASENRTFTSWYYGLNNIYLYEKFPNENLITDRHIVSNYAWSGDGNNDDIYDLLVKKIGNPTLTVILFADEETVIKRLKSRDKKDPDILRAKYTEHIYKKMIYFCEKYKFPYIVIDTRNLTPEEIVNLIIEKLGGFINEKN